MHYSGCLPTGTMSAHLLPPPWNPAYLTIFRQTDQIIGLVPRGRAPMARRRNRFCSALLDDYCAALVAGHDPMHRWVTGRREARWRCLLCLVPSLTCQLTWRRVAPDLAAAWSGGPRCTGPLTHSSLFLAECAGVAAAAALSLIAPSR